MASLPSLTPIQRDTVLAACAVDPLLLPRLYEVLRALPAAAHTAAVALANERLDHHEAELADHSSPDLREVLLAEAAEARTLWEGRIPSVWDAPDAAVPGAAALAAGRAVLGVVRHLGDLPLERPLETLRQLLAGLTTIRSVQLEGGSVCGERFQALLSAPALAGLERFTADAVPFTSARIVARMLTTWTGLGRLALADCGLDDLALEGLSGVGSHGLGSLNLRDNAFTLDGVAELAAAQLGALESLCLVGIASQQEALALLAASPYLRSLRELTGFYGAGARGWAIAGAAAAWRERVESRTFAADF